MNENQQDQQNQEELKFATTWQYNPYTGGPGSKDADGFHIGDVTDKKEITAYNRSVLQEACWNKFFSNPFVNTSMRATVGRIVGNGFDVSSDNLQIQQVIKEITFDHRNSLYKNLSKYLTRRYIEGELFLLLTVHNNGFIEVDFVDPSVIRGIADGDGIIMHPNKPQMPLVYTIDTGDEQYQVPSIYIARYPELINVAKKDKNNEYNEELIKFARTSQKKFKKLGGFNRFILQWDTGLVTKRNVGHLQSTLKWLNHYELLKDLEIDHKRSSSSYCYVCEFEDARAYKLWASMSDADRAKTGLMAKKTTGGTLVLPPGVTAKIINPQLQKISDSDTDILAMISSGLNESSNVMTGQNKGTYASSKSQKGPATDRIQDEIIEFNNFWKYDFWSAIFFLKNAIGRFPKTFKVREAVDFKGKEPVFKMVTKNPEELIKITNPVSADVDYEGVVKSFCGVKHGSLNETLGLSNELIASKLGINNYKSARLQTATEDDKFPELITAEDQETAQEKVIEPPEKKKKVDKSA